MVLDSELRRNEKNRKKDRGLFQMLKHVEVLLKQAMIVLGMFLLPFCRKSVIMYMDNCTRPSSVSFLGD